MVVLVGCLVVVLVAVGCYVVLGLLLLVVAVVGGGCFGLLLLLVIVVVGCSWLLLVGGGWWMLLRCWLLCVVVGGGAVVMLGWCWLARFAPLLQASQARKDLSTALVAKRASNGEEYIRVAMGKATSNFSMDQSWALEQKIVELLAGAAAEERTKQTLLSFMPTATAAKQPKDVLLLVAQFKASDAMKFAPAAIQGAVEVIEGVVDKLASSSAPVLSLVSSTPLARSIFQRCGHFLRITVGENVMTGEDAILHLCKKLQEGSIEAAECNLIRVYKWLIAADKLADIDAKLGECDGGDEAGEAVGRPRKRARTTAAKSRKAKQNVDNARASAADMFET